MREPCLQEVIDAFRQAFGTALAGIVLFGSRARAEARPESDWDLLVLVDTLPSSPLERSRALRRTLPARWRGRVAIVAKTPPEFETEFPSYYLDLATDGQILFDRNGYLEDRLRVIRQRIQEAGLRRQKIGKGFLWTWESPPPGPWRIDWSSAYGLDGRR